MSNSSRTRTGPTFSFVLPAYNEAAGLPGLARRLIAAGEKLGRSFEIVWVNDGSDDATGDILDRLAEEDTRIRVVHLARNFGHMAALAAGFDHALGTGAVICLDSDGQHPPELIPDLVAQWEQGADIVQTIRDPSPHEGYTKRTTAKCFYRLLNWLSDVAVPEGAADFRLLDRQVVDVLVALPERDRFLRGLVFWPGFKKHFVHYTAQPRTHGRTKYRYGSMLRLALSGITSFSQRPLRLAFFMGAAVTVCAALYALYILRCTILGVPLVPGWTSTILVVLILGGIQLFTLAIASEYIARIYTEVKHRPLYVSRLRCADALY